MILTASKTLSLRKNHIISHLKGTLPNTYFYATYYIYIYYNLVKCLRKQLKRTLKKDFLILKNS